MTQATAASYLFNTDIVYIILMLLQLIYVSEGSQIQLELFQLEENLVVLRHSQYELKLTRWDRKEKRCLKFHFALRLRVSVSQCS